MFSRFVRQARYDGWCIVDRMTGLDVADAAAVPLSGLDPVRADLILEALAIGEAAGRMSSYIALGRLCVDTDQWILGPEQDR
jgi:hypothetical protein